MNAQSIREILLLHHSHLDIGYTHSQPIMWELQNEYLEQVIDWLEETENLAVDARPRWTCEATEPVRRWLAQSSSSQVERFIRLHKAGRLGVSALRWHTTGLADRKGLERLLDGKKELEQLLGAKIAVACQHDVTGASWPLADVLLDGGVDFFVMAVNIHLGRALKLRPGMFLWEAPSGRKLRVWNGHHYTMFDQLLNAWDDSVDRMVEGWEALARKLQARKYPYDFVYLTSTCSPIMWDNAPNNPYLPALISRWNEAGRGPCVRYATFDDLRQRAVDIPDAALPVMRGDWTDYWNFGVASSPISTARSQQAKPIIEATETIIGTAAPSHASTLDRAKEKVDLYDEHTFGYYDSDHANPLAQSTELLKQALAHEGHEYAAFSLMDALERLAQNPVADRGIKGVLLCNPGPHPITVCPELPDAWFTKNAAFERTYRANRMFYDARSWGTRFPGVNGRVFNPVELPPFSWKVLPMDELSMATATKRLSHTVEVETIARREVNFASIANYHRRIGRIESPFHTLRYDQDSGRVVSLLDKRQSREVLAPRDALDLFGFVRERTDPLVEDRRYAFYQRDLDKEKIDEMCWQDWSPVREGATRVTHCEVTENAGRITLVRELEAPGMLHLVQRFSFFAHDPVIRLELEMELIPNPSPQGIYFGVPLDMQAGWRAAFDTAGAVVRLDDDQLPGACRNWLACETMAAIWDDKFCVALFTPDAPMVQFGDFHFGRPLDALPRPGNPLLLAWPVNNYWDTNFPRVQSGRICLRYGLATFGKADLALMREEAQKFRQPTIAWPVTCGGRGKAAGRLS